MDEYFVSNTHCFNYNNHATFNNIQLYTICIVTNDDQTTSDKLLFQYNKHKMYVNKSMYGYNEINVNIYPSPLVVRCDVIDMDKGLATIYLNGSIVDLMSVDKYDPGNDISFGCNQAPLNAIKLYKGIIIYRKNSLTYL